MSAQYKIWNGTNQIVNEDLSDIDTLVHRNVYRSADQVLYSIVQQGERMRSPGSQRDEQVANVISFLGKRGRGKTSAMVSFYSCLNKLQNKDGYNWSMFKKKNGDANIRFYNIPCIDAAMLAKNEFVLDVILAKMWDEFSEFLKSQGYILERTSIEYLVKQVQDEFVNVRRAYYVLKSRELNKDSDIEKEKDIPAASALHELAVSMNLKEEIKRLIENYIRVLDYDRKDAGDNVYLLIAIDDVDMADGHAWEILEQIRRYLSMPKVIILMTADLDRLKNVCEMSCRDVYSQGKGQSRFVNDYLEKVLPINQRIYMPELSDGQDILIPHNEALPCNTGSEKKMILELIAKRCDIYFDGIRRRRHFLQNDSLRSLVNYFNKVAGIEDDEYIGWLQNDLRERLVERVENIAQREFLLKLFTKDYEDINNLVLVFLKETLGEKALDVSDVSMGQVLYGCSLLEDKNVENADFVNCILVWYAIMMKQTVNHKELRSAIIGNSIWGEWENGFFLPGGRGASDISGFSNRAALKFEMTEVVLEEIRNKRPAEAVQGLIESRKTEITAWLCAMLFVNIAMPASEKIDVEIKITEKKGNDKEDEIRFPEKDSQIKHENNETIAGDAVEKLQRFELCPKVRAQRGLFAFLYRDPESYKIVLEQLFEAVIVALCKKVDLDSEVNLTEEEIKAILENNNELFNDVIAKMETKTETETEKVKNSLLQSTEMLYCIGKVIGRERMINTSESENLVEKMTSLCQSIRQEFRKRDKYYWDKITMETNFEAYFTQRMQTRVLLDLSVFSEDIKRAFEEQFISLFRGVTLVK